MVANERKGSSSSAGATLAERVNTIFSLKLQAAVDTKIKTIFQRFQRMATTVSPCLQLSCSSWKSPLSYASNAMAAGPMLARRFSGPLLRRAFNGRIITRPRSVAVAAWKQEVLWAEAPVVEADMTGESLYHVAVDISDNPELMAGHTNPGQFVQVRVRDSKPTFLAIASPPAVSSGGRLEFLVKDVEGSTAALICDLRKGDTVELSQVLGNGFDISQISPSHQYSTVFLFATGSGISPIRSLLESGFDAKNRSDVRLYYGVRNLQRMAYKERFKEWESSGVKIVPVLSRSDDDWSGERGYVQDAFSKAKQVQNPLATGAVLCGHKQMAECDTVMREREMDMCLV
ncbi:fruit protein pKIWI502 isoform X2 [Cryptomeria japonica]|uniref:fruit protein pKIWI502 isoform X2 n=1 Tax=Cryptomeria japonica TaxID=3369 RepID=UPI0027DA1689|nr:fruit protein pKIWI502 isoform X2 [Cryptomeria japonica]